MTLTHWLFFSCFLPLSLFSFTLQEKIVEEGHEGDTIVLQCGTTIYGCQLHTSPLRVTLAKAAEQVQEREGFSSWIEWMKNGSKNALEVTECPISEIKNHSPELNIFLHMSWKEQNKIDRKKQGPPPLPDEIDVRSIWNPKIVVHKKVLQGIISRSFEAVWPKDGSDLSERKVVIYMPQAQETIPWFPYWIELSGGKTAIFVLDSQLGTP